MGCEEAPFGLPDLDVHALTPILESLGPQRPARIGLKVLLNHTAISGSKRRQQLAKI